MPEKLVCGTHRSAALGACRFFFGSSPQEHRRSSLSHARMKTSNVCCFVGSQRAEGRGLRMESWRGVAIEKAVGGMRNPYALTTAFSVSGLD